MATNPEASRRRVRKLRSSRLLLTSRKAPMFILWALAASMPALAALEQPSPFGAFAFSDSTGTKVLALSEILAPERVHVLLAAQGRQFPVRYVGVQEVDASGPGRDTAWGFPQCGGQLYHLENEARIFPDETCYLATDTLLALGQPLLPLKPHFEALEVYSGDYLATLKGRPVKNEWVIAWVGQDGTAWLAEFEPQGPNYLATITLRPRSNILLTHDYRTVASPKDPYSLWRVDDQHEFCGECFELLFVLDAPAETWMAVSWGAAEGESLELLRSAGTDTFQTVLDGYRYWAPR